MKKYKIDNNKVYVKLDKNDLINESYRLILPLNNKKISNLFYSPKIIKKIHRIGG